MALIWGAWEAWENRAVIKDAEQIGDDIWNALKTPWEMLYNDWKILIWAYHNPLVGGVATLAGFLWGSIILQKMPGDFALVGPFLGAVTGAWGTYWLSTALTTGQPPTEWSLVTTKDGVSTPIADFTALERWIQWVALRPWESNTSFVAGATVGWLIAPDFPMSAVAILGGIAGVFAGYQLLSGSGTFTNPTQPAPLN